MLVNRVRRQTWRPTSRTQVVSTAMNRRSSASASSRSSSEPILSGAVRTSHLRYRHEAEVDPHSNGIPNNNPVFVELQHRHVCLHLHFGWSCVSSLGNVSVHAMRSSLSRAITDMKDWLKCRGHARPTLGHGFACRILFPMAHCWWPTILYTGESLLVCDTTMTDLEQIVAPERYRRFLSYFVGWCVLVGEISTTSSCALNSAEIVAALVEIMHPEVHWHVRNFRGIIAMSSLTNPIRLG